jgi:hypothetical protein
MIEDGEDEHELRAEEAAHLSVEILGRDPRGARATTTDATRRAGQNICGR